MISAAFVIAGTAFLAGMAAAVFAMVVIGIRKADHRRPLPGRNAPADAFTRTLLSANTWPGSPVVHGDHEDR